MINTASHAKRELDILSATATDPNNRPVIEEFAPEIIALCEKFGKSGQSGVSAPYTASAISQAVKKLMMLEVIAPLTGEDSEWADVTENNDGKTWYQNIRDSRVFKDGKDEKAYFIDAIVWDGNIGGRFTGSIEMPDGTKLASRQFIKSFPFKPKIFYVDVLDYRWKDKEEKEPDINGDWWTHKIKDEKQLNEVFEYYDKK